MVVLDSQRMPQNSKQISKASECPISLLVEEGHKNQMTGYDFKKDVLVFSLKI